MLRAMFLLLVVFGALLGGAPPSAALTVSMEGGGEATDNLQPSLGLKYLVRVEGAFDELGEVGLFAKTDRFTAGDPTGWMRAEGQRLPIANHSELYSLLGTRYGGDGETDFALPDLRGRTAIGAGLGPDATFFELGQRVGSESFVANPTHTHSLGDGPTVGDGLAVGENAGPATHSNYQPSLALTPIIAMRGQFPSQSSHAMATTEGVAPISSSNSPYLGELAWIAHDQPPEGWALADGQLLSINNNNSLYSLLGTMYGGNGSTDFALPDLRGRAAVGSRTGPGLTPRQLGAQFGAASETLGDDQTPPHTHDVLDGTMVVAQTGEAGGGVPQSNLQPSLAINYLAPLVGTFPSTSTSTSAQASGVGTLASESPEGEVRVAEIGSGFDPVLGSVSMFAGNFAPRGYSQANGQTLPIASNTALFSLLWNDYGGDAQSVFNLPDLRGRTPVGTGAGDGLTERLLAEQFGAEQSVLTLAQIAGHTHALPSLAGDYNGDGAVDAADYTVWRDGGSPDNSQAGFDLWAANYGATVVSTSLAQAAAEQTPVPEPAGAALLVLGGLLSSVSCRFKTTPARRWRVR